MSDSGWAAPDRPGTPSPGGTPAPATTRPPAPAAPPTSRITLPPYIPAPPAPPPPSSWAGGAVRTPGGLIPSGPPRPIYREPFPVRLGPLAAGAGSAALWMLLIGLLATNVRGYAWLTFLAGAAAWLTAAVLSRFGDRGVAVGVALSAAVGVAVAGIVVAVRWAGGDWVLW